MTKKTFWLIVVVIILIILGWMIFNKNESIPGSSENTISPTPTASVAVKKPATVKPKTNADDSLTYADALKAYGDKRVQFDGICQATPYQFTIRNGAKIMLDNRASNGKIIKMENQTYNLTGYGFKVVTISSSKPMPYDITVSCSTTDTKSSIYNSFLLKVQANILEGI